MRREPNWKQLAETYWGVMCACLGALFGRYWPEVPGLVLGVSAIIAAALFLLFSSRSITQQTK